MTTHTPKVQFADPREQEDLPIGILVGSDHYWKIVKDSTPLRISPSVLLLPSNLEWILSGNLSGISANVAPVNFLHLENPGPLPEREIRGFWDLETIGITANREKEWNTKDPKVLQAFHDSFGRESSRRAVSLPKKQDITLSINRKNADNRSMSLEKKLIKNAKVCYSYHTNMLDYALRGQVEVVNPDEIREGTFYMPHHAVSKGKQGETK